MFSLSTKGSDDYPKEQRPIAKEELRMADRYYVSSVLLEIFGPTAKDYIHEIIYKNVQAFAGPCDVYEQVRVNDTDVVDAHTSCFNRKDNSAVALVGKANIMASGYIQKICTILIQNEKTFGFALKQGSESKQLYALFHPYKKPADSILKALKEIKSKFLAKQDGVKAVLSFLCTEPSWRIL